MEYNDFSTKTILKLGNPLRILEQHFKKLPWRYMRTDIEVAELQASIKSLPETTEKEKTFKSHVRACASVCIPNSDRRKEPTAEEFRQWEEETRKKFKEQGRKPFKKETLWQKAKNFCSATVAFFKRSQNDSVMTKIEENSMVEKLLDD